MTTPTPRLVAEALARRAQRDAARAELNERRTHGLKARHRAKLARVESARQDGCAA